MVSPTVNSRVEHLLINLITTVNEFFYRSEANYGCISPGQAVVVFSPEHVNIVAGTGWTKSDVREYLFEQAKRPREVLEKIGKYFADYQHQDREDCHRGLVADDILITVGGGDAGGHSAFIPSWSRGRGSIMQSQSIGVCIDC